MSDYTLAQLREADPNLADNVAVNPVTSCWRWQRSHSLDGYGIIYLNRKPQRAHRRAYILLAGDLPDDRPILDHLCRVRDCINPNHLEPVTYAENVQRGDLPALMAARGRAKTHCKRGHEFTPENTGHYARARAGGYSERWCRTCDRERRRKTA